ncbi:hypothetical protein PF001_g28122 [Phytophthora fragariae]|uniref:Uncharacterized protein n=1 Tax=Phytophthora fragariae TaxID=53985 RepID=A0A6A4BI63_9STRA|nr:hypothetical protein PF001_g28122 [Phytophthora fragariae]
MPTETPQARTGLDAATRNDILAKYGRDKLDFIQYKPTQVAKEAAKQLRELRRLDKIHKRASTFKKGFDKGPQAKGEDQAERGSRSDTVQPTIGWVTADGLAGDEKVSRRATEKGAKAGMPSVKRDLDEEMTDHAEEQPADNAEESLEA